MDNTEPENTESTSTELENSEIESTELENSEIESTELKSSEIESTELKSSEIESTELESSEIESTELENSEIDLRELTVFELEKQLLDTFSKLIDIVGQNHKQLTTPEKLQPSSEQLFATSIHMAKSKNDVGAAKWMRRAAISGHVKAQYYLGLMFAKGNGLPQSEYHAVTWLALAESQGLIEAVEAKGKLQRLLCAKQIKDAQTQAANLYEQIQDEEFKFYIDSQNSKE